MSNSIELLNNISFDMIPSVSDFYKAVEQHLDEGGKWRHALVGRIFINKYEVLFVFRVLNPKSHDRYFMIYKYTLETSTDTVSYVLGKEKRYADHQYVEGLMKHEDFRFADVSNRPMTAREKEPAMPEKDGLLRYIELEH